MRDWRLNTLTSSKRRDYLDQNSRDPIDSKSGGINHEEIQSAGGPLIGLDRDDLHLWTGVFGKGFIGEASLFRTDYEAAGYLTDGLAYPSCNISRITGVSAHRIVITVPDYTAAIEIDQDETYIAQVDYCDAD